MGTARDLFLTVALVVGIVVIFMAIYHKVVLGH
jgi:hypothetical protein